MGGEGGWVGTRAERGDRRKVRVAEGGARMAEGWGGGETGAIIG